MIQIPYKCRCMTEEATVSVPARRADVDIVTWVQLTVVGAVTVDHRRRSPLCRSTTMEFIKIPAPENAPHIGGEPRLDA